MAILLGALCFFSGFRGYIRAFESFDAFFGRFRGLGLVVVWLV